MQILRNLHSSLALALMRLAAATVGEKRAAEGGTAISGICPASMCIRRPRKWVRAIPHVCTQRIDVLTTHLAFGCLAGESRTR